MRFTFGQRIAIRILAFGIRRGASHLDLREGLDKMYRRRPEETRIAMWRAALDRAGVRIG